MTKEFTSKQQAIMISKLKEIIGPEKIKCFLKKILKWRMQE
jgi:hypothetical protein